MEGHAPPGAVSLFPIQRCLPVLLLNGVPAITQPELGTPVASVAHELQVIAGGDQTRCQLDPMDEHPMPWALVVIGEAISFVSDPVEPLVIGVAADRAALGCRFRLAVSVGRAGGGWP